MITAIRLWNDDSGASHVEHGRIDLAPDTARSLAVRATDTVFAETRIGHALAWHTAPRRQYVITLTGVLDFATRDGESFRLQPGIVLVAEDTVGTGHRWEFVGGEPWRRMYVGIADGTHSGFVAD